MTTSFTRTREQIRSLVLIKLGVLASGGTVNSADADLVYEAIDLRLKEMHRLGIYWRKVDALPHAFTVTANVNSASASAEILFPISMTIRDGSNDEPVYIVSKRQYAEIEDKSETGRPTKALWMGSATFTFWPVPTATTTARLVYERFADDTTAGSAPDVDVAMMRSLCNIITYDVADMFGIDEAKITRWQKEALMAERQIRSLAVERVDYGPVKVDEYRRNGLHWETDYGR